MRNISSITRRRFVAATSLATTGLLPTMNRGGASLAGTSTSFVTHEATPVTTDRFERLASHLESMMVDYGIPGAVLGVFHRDEVFTRAAGVTDTHTNTPVTAGTAFRIASLTKLFTATGLVSLSNPDRLPLNAPLAIWDPSFRLADPGASATVTMSQALSHSGGWIDPPWPALPDDGITLADTVAEIAGARQLFPPGTLFNYSNSAYQLAGQILADHAKLPYEQALQERVLAPLNLRDTGFFRDQFALQTVASGHVSGGTGLEVVDPWQVPAAVHPTAGLLSTAGDLLRFVQFHAGVLPPGTGPLQESQRLAMLVPHGPGGSLGPIVSESIGLGWMRAQIGGRQLAMSFGSDAGLAASMAFAPDDEFGFVMLSNADPGLVVAAELLVEAIELFLDTSHAKPVAVTLPKPVLEQSTGRFTIPGDLSFELTVRDSDLWVSALRGDEPVPDINGPLTMLSANQGGLQMGPMRLMVDLLRDEAGAVAWFRFAARLARRDD